MLTKSRTLAFFELQAAFNFNTLAKVFSADTSTSIDLSKHTCGHAEPIARSQQEAFLISFGFLFKELDYDLSKISK